MTETAGRSRTTRRPRSSARTAADGSPGLPSSAGDDRMAELEARLDRLEGSDATTMREQGRRLVSRVMPAEANRHFINAAREQLLGFRAIVDFWIRRVDDMEDRVAASDEGGRQTIEID
jgi:hypothetical protein